VASKQPRFKSAALLRVGAMLDEINKFNSKPQNTSELKTVFQATWNKLSDETICKAIIGFHKRLNARVSASDAHFEHAVSYYGQSASVGIRYKRLHNQLMYH